VGNSSPSIPLGVSIPKLPYVAKPGDAWENGERPYTLIFEGAGGERKGSPARLDGVFFLGVASGFFFSE